MSRSDNVGMFWDDTPPPKPPPKEKIKRIPPPKDWERDDYLPNLKEALEFNVPLFTDAELMQAQTDGEQLVFDIECYPNYFLIAFKSVQSKKVVYFERSYYERFDINKLRWVMENFCIVSFNGNFYDMPIAAIALANNECEIMKQATDDIIIRNERAYKIYKQYGVKEIGANHIDVREVAPLSGSLKAYGGRLHTQRMQDLPFNPNKCLNEQQIAITRLYCINDLDQTMELFEKLEEPIRLRTQMSNEYGLDLRSKSDAQIAEAVINSELTKLFGKKPKRAYVEPGKVYKYNVPQYMEFESPTMKWVLEAVKKANFIINENGSVIMPPELANLQVPIGNGLYRMGIGGLHSCEKSTTHYSDEKGSLHDHDADSFYPLIILNQKLYPKHLGPSFLKVYRKIVTLRLSAKAKAAQAENNNDQEAYKFYKNIADSLKIVINGSFGKLGSSYSLLYSPDLLIQVTITGQLSLLMLIEMMELNGIPVVSANTDGIVVKCPPEKQPMRELIIQRWEEETNFTTSVTNYSALHSRDVNNYLAVKMPNKNNVVDIKTKGAYSKAGLSKNPTNTICIDALKEFLLNGTPVETTIKDCKDLRKFVTVRNVKGGAVPIRKIAYNKDAPLSEIKTILEANGWVDHYGKWVRQAWVGDKKPLDVMSLDVEAAFAACPPVEYGQFLGKVVRWYYSTEEREVGEIVYAGSGNKVPRSEGAKQCMDFPNSFPADLDFEWYIEEVKSILNDVGIAA